MDFLLHRPKLIAMNKTKLTLVLASLLLSSTVMLSHQTMAQTTSRDTAITVSDKARYDFDVSYDIYAGGMHLLDVLMQFNQSNAAYSASMTANPTGFFSKIVPWQGRYSTDGAITKGQLIPKIHEKTSRWGKDRDETIMRFNAQGQLASMTDREWIHGKTIPAPKNITPDAALSGDAHDLVTTVVRMLYHAQQTGLSTKEACNSTHTVFDGKRRFTMAFTPLGQETLQKSRYTPFSGKAQRCQIEIKPLAGFKGKKRGFYKIQEDSRKLGELPSIWLMPAWDNGPPVPVRMRIKSEYGAIIVHAAKVTRK
jgi:hypothetical protein